MMETDWEEGRPPKWLEIDVFAYGCVRRGWSDGSYFIPLDCTHPAQNVTLDLDRITHWRARDSIKVIPVAPTSYLYGQPTYPMGVAGFWESLVGSAVF
jgi:hypothetical protein